MQPAIAVLALVMSAAPALAFDTRTLGQWGSLPIEDIKPLIDKTPKLKREIDEALAKLGKKQDDIMCDGRRFPGPWEELGGTRVSPYSCQFGERWLVIRTKVRVTGKGGKVYERASREAMRRAKDVAETNPTWSWHDKEPENL
jgi:hypothetical protein